MKNPTLFTSFFFKADDNAALFSPAFAFDGLFHHGHTMLFISTYDETKPWLQIDMGQEETLARVELFFRTSGFTYSELAYRRENIEVRFGNILASTNSTGNPECATLSSLPTSFRAQLNCITFMTGRYLVIRRDITYVPMEIDEVFAYSV